VFENGRSDYCYGSLLRSSLFAQRANSCRQQQVIMFSMTNMQGNKFFFFLVLFEVLTIGHAMSHVVTLLCKDSITAMSAMMGIVAFSYMLNGQIIKRDDMNDSLLFLYNTSFIYDSFDALACNEFGSASLQEVYAPDDPYDWLYYEFFFTKDDKWVMVRTLLYGILIFRVGTYMLLKYKYVETR